jgi:Domain of unknown function (DUF4112)
MTKTNQEKLEFIKKYAKLLDSQFTIPGTKFKFGLDPLLSLVPILGSFSGLVTGVIFILLAHRQGVSGKAKMMMTKNVFIDYAYGLIPILGNIKDFLYKSNLKNVKILEEHLLEDQHQGSGLALFLQMLFVMSLLLILAVIVSFYIIKWIIELL